MAEKAPKTQTQDGPQQPPTIKEIIRDDVVGVSDFRRSKVGSLTGASAARRIAADFSGQISESASRTGSLFKNLTARENVPSLPEGGEADERFTASMRLHGRTERDLEVIVRNSYRSSWLYMALSLAGTCLSFWSLYAHPAHGFFDVISRIGPLPLVYALALKHMYTNWMVRRRRLDSLMKFLSSWEWLPKISD